MTATETMPAQTLAGVDLATLSTDELEDGICGFAARLAAATCAFVLAVAEYDRRRGWESWECRSMAHWLTWKCAMGPVAAREHVRVGAALAELGLVRARFGAGALSYSQVRAITRAATPATEADLVDLAAAMTAAQLETVVRAYRRARPDVTDPDRAPHARRKLNCYTDDDGSLVGTFRLPPEDGAVLVAALAAAATDRGRAEQAPTEPDNSTATGDGGDGGDRDPTLDPPAAGRADAMVALAGAYLERAANSDNPEGGSDGTDNTADRYLVTIIAERRVLQDRGEERPDGVCQIDDGPGLDPGTVRRLACEAPTVTIVEDQFGHVLDVGRRTRRVNRALRRALARRDGGCQFPGCDTRRTQAHHVTHWIDGGPTTVANLISLCSRHHHRHHQGAYTITPGPDKRWVFTRADGRPIPTTVSPPATGVGPDPGVEPAVTDCTQDWEGDVLSDLSGIVDGLLRREGLLNEDPMPTPWPDIDPPAPWVTNAHDSRPSTDPAGAARWPNPWRDPWQPNTPWPGQ